MGVIRDRYDVSEKDVNEIVETRDLDALMTRLSDPETVRQLNSLLDNLGTLSAMLEMFQGFMSRSNEVLENANALVHETGDHMMADHNVTDGLASLATIGHDAIPLAQNLALTHAIERIADSGLLEPAFVDIFVAMMKGFNDVREEFATGPEERRISMMRLPWMMRDRDFNRGVKYVLHMAQKLGWAVKPNGLHGIGPGKG